MNRFVRPIAWIMALLMTAALFTMPAYAAEVSGGGLVLPEDDDSIYTGYEKPDPNTLQSEYDITLIPSPIAKDDKDGSITIQLHLAYRGDADFKHAPLSYFRIMPVISTATAEFPFQLDYSAYEQGMEDIHVVYGEDGEVTDTYFEFPFKVREDAVNGFYAISFKTYHLYGNTFLHEATPPETTLTTYVEIRHGKKAAGGTDVPSSDPSTAILLLEGYTA